MVAAIPLQSMDMDFGKVRMKANGIITAGTFVVLGTDGVAPAADSCTTGVFGIALTSAASGAVCVVATKGIFTVDLATNFDPDVGDIVYVASASTVDIGSTGDFGVGVIVGSVDPTSGLTASMLLTANQASVGIAK